MTVKRFLLFALTNVAVVVTIGFVVRVLGVDRVIEANSGINYQNLLVLSLLWGMGGSFISLLLSKTMAKWSTGAHLIKTPSNSDEAWLLDTVKDLAGKAGIGMPDVAIYDAPDMNAFATGAFRNSSLVAVSTGLLRGMSRQEVEAVLAHEISHVSNGDMVTMALMQGVVNAFVIFFSRLLRLVLSSRDENGRRSNEGLAFLAEIVAQVVLTLLGSILCAWFSRQREFRADAGAAKLRGPHSMIAALQRLAQGHSAPLPGSLKAFGIAGGMGQFFSTHPPIEKRIEALQSFR